MFAPAEEGDVVAPADAAVLEVTGGAELELELQAAAPAVEPGFTSLFNGKDFTGWKIVGPPETFTIQDGAIVAKGAASHAYYDGGFRNHSFRDFELNPNFDPKVFKLKKDGGTF